MNSPQPRRAAIAKPMRMGRVSPRVRLRAMQVSAALLLRNKGQSKAWFRLGTPKGHLAYVATYAAGDAPRSAQGSRMKVYDPMLGSDFGEIAAPEGCVARIGWWAGWR